MMKRMLLGIILLGCTSLCAAAQTQDVFKQRDTLQGLSGVIVSIVDLEPDIKKDGLNEQQLQTDVELRLRKSGVKVHSWDEFGKNQKVGVLIVQVTSQKIDSLSKALEHNIYSYSVSIQVRQAANLYRMPEKAFFLTTWSDEGIGMTTTKAIKVIRERVGDNIDKFCNDFLAVNPR